MKTKHQTVLTAGQMRELICAVQEGIPTNIEANVAQYWIGRKKKLAAEIKKILVGMNLYADLIADWQSFYHDLFGIEVENDFSNLVIPEKRGGFDRLLVVVNGMNPQRLYGKCAELFKVWKWTEKNLDEIVTSDRSAKNGAYAIWVRNQVEADEELKNLSANQIKAHGIPGITLEERFIYELKYFKETGNHLDIQNWTLCSGSRYGDGRVPCVRWDPDYGGLDVDWCAPGFRDDRLRARQAVS